jgi:uncharacterized protein YcfJ
MNKTLVITASGLLLAGVAFAAYKNSSFGPQYADVTSVTPITVKENVYGDVIGVNAITQATSGSKQVCENQTVQRRKTERYGNKDGALLGVVVGGLVGNQIGGDGKKLATVAGAVGGGFAGREIDERHLGGQKYTATERVCHNEATSGTKTVGYDVQYRTVDGQTLSRRENKKPGDRLLLGTKDVVTGYDVTWRYDDKSGKLLMEEKPGDRLAIKDGVILVAAKSSESNSL